VQKYNRDPGSTIALPAPHASPDDIQARAIKGQDVVFLGWQRTTSGDLHPLYNILKAGHSLYLSTSLTRHSGNITCEFHGPHRLIPVWDRLRGWTWY